MDERYDLVVVGSGSAAFSAAIEARRQGRSVLMVERATIGGTCVNVGCVPSKALLAAAEARHTALAQVFPGVTTAAGDVDLVALVRAKDDLVAGLREDKYVRLARDYGWEVVRGVARFVGTAGQPAVEVDGHTVAGEHYLIATGATPWAPPINGLGETGYLTSTSAFALERVPTSMIVAGGNAVGLEVGQLFARLGTRVTLVEALPRIAPQEEPEISDTLAGVLCDEGVEVHTGASASAVRRDGDEIVLHADLAEGALELRAEHLLLATGRRANTDSLELHAVGVAVAPEGHILVDEHLATTNARVWAAGDVTGHPQFVYAAGAHGAIVVANAFNGAARRVDYTTLPRVTFTSPNIASVGLTEMQARAQGLDCEARTVPLEYVPRALVNRDTRGLVKLVAERAGGRVRGLHLLADNAGDTILAGVYALQAGMTVAEIANTWAPYLTMSEGIKLAAQGFSSDISKLSCCAA